MIRFCDREIVCVADSEIDRQQLMAYFLDGHREEEIYILNEAGEYTGRITYASILGKSIEEAVNKEFVMLDEKLWENGRRYFRQCREPFGGMEILPVLNKKKQLLCFAYEDNEANRQIRMLDELILCADALTFRDVYPEYGYVTIRGCNELAYYFAQYLEKHGIEVSVTDEVWREFGRVPGEREVPDYANLVVYADGLDRKEKDPRKRKSVSVEFECIDRIYEANVCRGIIGDAAGGVESFIKKIKDKNIIIIGEQGSALDAYDVLLGYGLDILCFISEKKDRQGKNLFGKMVVSRKEALQIRNSVYIDAEARYSAWGFGWTDMYCYWGCKRNETFFTIKDYMDIPGTGWLNILRNLLLNTKKRLILMGDIHLCTIMRQLLEKEGSERIRYLDVLNTEESDKVEIQRDICMLLCPEYYGLLLEEERGVESYKALRKKYMGKIPVSDGSWLLEYSVENEKFMMREHPAENDWQCSLKVKGIIIGSIEASSGNILFRNLLDNHPQILMIEYGYLNHNLFSICLRLAVEEKDAILPLFWKLFEDEEGRRDENWQEDFPDKEKFNKCMRKMLAETSIVTSQKLFIMFHVAYAKMWGREIKDIASMVIYWEPHFVPRDVCESYAQWLDGVCSEQCIINIVRNICAQTGSYLKNLEAVNFFSSGKFHVFSAVTGVPDFEKKDYAGWKRVIVRFEDLKCNPRETLTAICRETGISWSDTLLETTSHGLQSSYADIKGFDLRPVYRTYEEYFSSFDRFRISVIRGSWQKLYGYPYVSSLDFSKRELQEMFLKEFRFEKRLVYCNNDEKERIKKWEKRLISDCLQMTRRREILDIFKSGGAS